MFVGNFDRAPGGTLSANRATMRNEGVALTWLFGVMVACAAPLDQRVDDAEPMAPNTPATTATTATAGTAPTASPPRPPSTVETLKLARVVVDHAVHTIAITKDDGDTLEGVDLAIALGEDSHYSLDLVTKHGFAKLAELVDAGARMKIARRDLLPPIAEGNAQVNAAENYADHQAETGATATMPFLFPKVAQPTGCEVTVARQSRDLLDYESELCVAFGRDLEKTEDLQGTTVGFMLCNDLSERATQVLKLDPSHQSSGKGFTDAKSRPGFLPVGPYVVVPRNPRTFLPTVTLRLWVNGEQRQEDSPKNMIWDVERLVTEALAAGADPRFELDGKPLALLPEGKLAKGMLLVSGTPGGIILEAPSTQYKVLAAAAYVATGAFLSGKSVEQYVQEKYVDDLRASGKFLKPGDVVEAEGTFLGRQRITISGAND